MARIIYKESLEGDGIIGHIEKIEAVFSDCSEGVFYPKYPEYATLYDGTGIYKQIADSVGKADPFLKVICDCSLPDDFNIEVQRHPHGGYIVFGLSLEAQFNFRFLATVNVHYHPSIFGKYR